VNKYQIITENGVAEIEELDNGINIECLIGANEAYLQKLAEQPTPTTILSETSIIGQQLVEKDLQILELQQENQVLGQQMVGIDLRLLMGGM